MTLLALWLPLISIALASKLEHIADLQQAGDDAEVVATVDRWEAQDALGDDAAVLIILRDRSALKLALAAHSVKALADFRATYPESSMLPDALKAEQDLAFDEAQSQGTAAALRSFLAAYPGSASQAQAAALEEGLAYQEALATGAPEALEAFRQRHPASSYLTTAWEGIAARSPGIYVRLADGGPKALPETPVLDYYVPLPRPTAMAPIVPSVAVNLPGTGRGATSEWWGLSALGSDGTFRKTSPTGASLRDAFGAAPPWVLDLVEADGVHSARVATTVAPLVTPGSCGGFAYFAFVLQTTEGTRTAFPFAVSCTLSDADVETLDGFAIPAVLTAVETAERGDVATAGQLWKKALGLTGGSQLSEWLTTQAGGQDPFDKWITRRAATGDVLVWTPSPLGGETTWWHAGADSTPMALAHRDGLWIADGAHLWTVREETEAWSAAAGGGCQAATGQRTALSLADVLGTQVIPIPALSDRGGAMAPTSYAGGVLSVTHDGAAPGCRKSGPPVVSTVALPDAQAATLPGWAASTAAGAGAVSVVGDDVRQVYWAFAAEEEAAP